MIRSMALCLAAMTAGFAGESYLGAQGYWIEAVVSAYSPLDEFTRDDAGNPKRLTATGVSTLRRPYGVAADPDFLPYGTRVIIPTGFNYLDRSSEGRVFLVDDTGSMIRRFTRQTGLIHLDLRYRSVASAKQFGVKIMPVFVVTGGPY